MFKFLLVITYLYNGLPTSLVYAEYPGRMQCENHISEATNEFETRYNPAGYPLVGVSCLRLPYTGRP